MGALQTGGKLQRAARASSKLCLLLLLCAAQVSLSHPLLGGLAAGLAAGLSHAGGPHTGPLLSKAPADVTKSAPTYPTAADYASGVCAGYAFCFASWNPPVLTEPDVVCPSGYEVTQQHGKPFCVQKLGLCPSGYDLSSSGQCCKVKTQSLCFPSWDSCSAADGLFADSDFGSICKGSPEYTTLINQIEMVDVTSGNPSGSNVPATLLPSGPTLSGPGSSSSSSSSGGTVYYGSSGSSGGGYSSIGGSSGTGVNVGVGVNAGGQQLVGNDVTLGSSNNLVGTPGQAVDVLPPGAVVVGDVSSGSSAGSSSSVPRVVAGGSDGTAALPPGAIVIDGSNGVATGGNNNNGLPVITVEEQPPAAPGAPAPVIINIDSSNGGGSRGVNNGQTPLVINGGSSMGYKRGGGGFSNPTVVPPGSLINVNGQVVRVGGSNGAAAGSSGGSGWAGGSNGAAAGSSGGSLGAAVDADWQLSDVQTIPAGSFVDLGGGRVVQVGAQPRTNTGGNIGGGMAAGGSSNMAAPAPPLVPFPQQQAASDALRSRADAAGSFVWTPQPGGASPTGGAGTADPDVVDVTNSSGSSSSSGIAPDDDSYDDTYDDSAANGTPAAGTGGSGASPNQQDAPDSNAGGVLDGDFGNDGGEWPLAAAGAGGADQQQEAGRLSLPGSSVPIFEEITYETADGQPWKPSARQQAAAAAKKQQQVLQPQQQQQQRKRLQPTYAVQQGKQQYPVQTQQQQQRLTTSNMRQARDNSSGSVDASDSSSSSSSSSGSSSSRSKVGIVSVAATAGLPPLLPPPPKAMLMKMLLLLPKLQLGQLSAVSNAGRAALAKIRGQAATELLAAREVIASLSNHHKEDFLPKCFQKCCTQDADVVCTPAKQSINYAKPQLVCPHGCELNSALGKCVCRAGSYSPCLPTDTVCSWGDQPICVGSSEFFGVPACTFVGALQKHLPRVQCPY